LNPLQAFLRKSVLNGFDLRICWFKWSNKIYRRSSIWFSS